MREFRNPCGFGEILSESVRAQGSITQRLNFTESRKAQRRLRIEGDVVEIGMDFPRTIELRRPLLNGLGMCRLGLFAGEALLELAVDPGGILFLPLFNSCFVLLRILQ